MNKVLLLLILAFLAAWVIDVSLKLDTKDLTLSLGPYLKIETKTPSKNDAFRPL